jgi:hypothetical protein
MLVKAVPKQHASKIKDKISTLYNNLKYNDHEQWKSIFLNG